MMATPGEPNLESFVEAASQAANVLVDLPSGKPLQEKGASELLRANAAPIVVFAGAPKSGKTTLLASIHDSFQRRPFAGFLAAGSRTLIGFEERCFDSRLESGAEEPTTLRTRPAEGCIFYHMKLRDEELRNPIKHLLLADMSGEHYSGALDSAAEMRALTIISRADHFVHLVDGGKLVSKELSALTQSNAMMLMRRCVEEGMFERDAKVEILLTKWDIAIALCGAERAQAVLKLQQDAFISKFGNQVARIRVSAIAARPHFRSELQPPYGVGDLFRSWADEPPRKSEPRARLLCLAPLKTGYDTFALREAPQLFEERPSD